MCCRSWRSETQRTAATKKDRPSAAPRGHPPIKSGPQADSQADSLPHKLHSKCSHLGIPDPLDFPERKGRSMSQNGRAARFLRGQAPKGARPTSRSGSGGGCCLNREAHRLYSREVAQDIARVNWGPMRAHPISYVSTIARACGQGVSPAPQLFLSF
jgi:hypothetical protein